MKKYLFILLALFFTGHLMAQKTNQRKSNQRKSAYMKFDGIYGERHKKPVNDKTVKSKVIKRKQQRQERQARRKKNQSGI